MIWGDSAAGVWSLGIERRVAEFERDCTAGRRMPMSRRYRTESAGDDREE